MAELSGVHLLIKLTMECINLYNLNMHVSSQPYLKTYLFPLFSLGTAVRLVVLILAVVLPFFMTYSTPNFFLTSHLQTYTQSIVYSYKYHIGITTASSKYLYTNLYQEPTSAPPTLTQSNEDQVVQFGIEWSKSPADRVKSVEVSLFFTFYINGVAQFGSASARVQGYSLADVSIAGLLETHKGAGSTALTATDLALSEFDLGVFKQKALGSAGYLQYDYSVLPVNLPSDILKVNLVLNYGGLLGLQETPSILGQLVWSWVQYFPIFLSLFWCLDKMFCFLVREQIIKRKVIHDPDYMSLLSSEEERRNRLSLG